MSIINKDNYLGTSINYTYYSYSNERIHKNLINILDIFKNKVKEIESINDNNYGKKSDAILKTIEKELLASGFIIETNKKNQVRIQLSQEKEVKEFRVDAINPKTGIIIEIEAGRAVSNYQFLKDMIECSMISSKKLIYLNKEKTNISNDLFLVIAVRNIYYFSGQKHNDYKTVKKWLKALDISKLNLKIKGILLIGY